MYELISRPIVLGFIRDVYSDLSDDDIDHHLRSPAQRVARIRRLGKTPNVMLTFFDTADMLCLLGLCTTWCLFF